MYKLYSQTSFPSDHSYKLIQLTPELLEYVESSAGDLTIKVPDADKNYMVLCTESKTYELLQMNHTNTVLLSNDLAVNSIGQRVAAHAGDDEGGAAHRIVAFSSTSYEYVTQAATGHIDTSALPVYDGRTLRSQQSRGAAGAPPPPPSDVSVAALLASSPISRAEFDREWYDVCGSELHGRAVVLSRPFVTEILTVLITILIAESIDYRAAIDAQRITALMVQQNAAIDTRFVETILHKFAQSPAPGAASAAAGTAAVVLDHEKISTWFGIHTLFESNHAHVHDDDFLLRWKSSLPAFYNVPIDLAQIRGNYCRPSPDKIQHVDPSTLSVADIGSRFKDLLAISKEWDYDEFIPFIQSYVPFGKKPDSLILKYARKRRVGKKFVVGPR